MYGGRENADTNAALILAASASVPPIPVSHETTAPGGDDDDRLNGSVAARRIIQPMCAIASAFSVNGCSAIITIESYVKTHQKHLEQ